MAGVVWLVLLQFPAFYNRHRVLVLCAVRLVVGFACLHATSSSGGGTIDSSSGILASTQSSAGGQRQQPFEGYEWPALMLLVQLLLASNTAHVAVEAARLPLPWLAQCMLVACKPIITLLNHRALPGVFVWQLRAEQALEWWVGCLRSRATATASNMQAPVLLTYKIRTRPAFYPGRLA